MKAVKNPDASKKKAIGINLSSEVIDYFKGLSKEEEIPYQTLIDFYLRECESRKNNQKLNGHVSGNPE
ncbi:MAG: antitoxin [Nitrospirae bacterium]|nr:antitoxin [Nitrospirota bacterium]